MQRVWVCTVIMVLLAGASVFGAWLVDSSCERLSDGINEAKSLYDEGEISAAVERMDALYDEWDMDLKIMSCLAGKDRLSGLNASIARVKPFMETENDELDAEILSVLYQLDLLRREEKPYYWNIL